MAYEILTAIFETLVPTPALEGLDTRRPFFKMTNISFKDAQMTYTSLQDDNDKFDFINVSYTGPLPVQNPSEVTMLGAGTTPVQPHHILTPFPGSYIADANGNQFVIMFPAHYDPAEGMPFELSRKAVLIIPLKGPIIDGVQTWPTFNPNGTYSYTGPYSSSISGVPLDYGPQRPSCFTLGTEIETDRGLCLIETLSVGDRVMTLDHGLQPIRWIGRVTLPPSRLDLQPNLRPISIRAGALAPGVPLRDLEVSPQHRILVRSPIAARMFDASEVLVAAKHLVGIDGVTVSAATQGVTYLHLLLDQHQIIRSNGAWTETLFVGPNNHMSLSSSARREIAALFPELIAKGTPQGSRRFLTGREAKQLALRHTKNRRVLAPVS